MRHPLVISGVAFLLASAGVIAAVGPPPSVVFVVNKANPVDALSVKDLKQIFSGEKTKWPDGQKIQTMASSPDMPEHKAAIEFLFGMTEPDYQKYCIHAGFVNHPEEFPRDFGSSATVVRLVGVFPGAIGFVGSGVASTGVKVLKIEGH